MRSQICKAPDQIAQIVYNNDGTISAYDISPSTGQLVPYFLKKPCCEILGGKFDVNTQKCNHNKSITGCTQPFNIVLNPKGNDGAIFSSIENETCTLDVEFDYLFKFDCDKLTEFIDGVYESNCNSIDDIFENLGAAMTIDKMVQTRFGMSATTIYQQEFFTPIGTGNLLDYLTTNSGNTGFYICQENEFSVTCNDLDLSDDVFVPRSNCRLFAEQMLLKYPTIPSNSFASDWLTFNTSIIDPIILSAITDEKIKLSITISGFCIDMCVLIDNIRLNKVCTKSVRDDIFVTKSPGFELDRIIDNKKSWVRVTETTRREFSIRKTDDTQPIRQTDYYLEDERQVLNTKEIDLDIDIANAIETDVWCYISDNPCLLTGTTIDTTTCVKIAYTGDSCGPKTYCCSEYCGDTNIDLQRLLTQPLTDVETIEDFRYYITSQLIDAKNRQISPSYATLRLLYDRYMRSLNHCGTQSSMFDYFKMEDFADLIGNYWVDLIEQVIPATTIWGSTRIYTNTFFDGQKHKYKAHTTLFGEPDFIKVLSPTTGATCDVHATTMVITGDTNTLPQFNQQDYTRLHLIQYNSGSEFIGTVKVIGREPECDDKIIVECDLGVRIDDNISTNGTLTAIPIGAIGTVEYIWTTPNGTLTTQTIEPSAAGLYSVVIKNNCCEASASIKVAECFIDVSITATDPSGDLANGTATANAINPQGNITYLWSNGQTTQTITGLTAGTYTVVIADDAFIGCTATTSVTLFETMKFSLNGVSTFGVQQLVTNSSGYRFFINWGDGNVSTYSGNTLYDLNAVNHTYSTPYTGDVTFRSESLSGITSILNVAITGGTYVVTTNNLKMLSNLTTLTNVLSVSGDVVNLPRTITQLGAINGTIFGNVANLPTGATKVDIFNNTLSGDVANLPRNITTGILQILGLNTISGDVANLPMSGTNVSIEGLNTISGNISGLSDTYISINITGNNTIFGDVSNIPSGATLIQINGFNTLSGDVTDLPQTITNFGVQGLNTITGDIANLPPLLTNFLLNGNNTIFGDLYYIPSGLTRFDALSNNAISDYTAGRTWAPGMRSLDITAFSGNTGFTSTEIDNLLIDLANTTWAPFGLGNPRIILKGTRTSASDAAFNTLTGGTPPVTITITP